MKRTYFMTVCSAFEMRVIIRLKTSFNCHAWWVWGCWRLYESVYETL